MFTDVSVNLYVLRQEVNNLESSVVAHNNIATDARLSSIISYFCLLWLMIGMIFYSRLVGKFYFQKKKKKNKKNKKEILFSLFIFIGKLYKNEIQSWLFGSF